MYINNETKYLDFPAGMFPTTQLPAASPGITDDKILANNIANGYFKDKDFELVKVLYFLRFATFSQLCKLLNIATEDEATFQNRLNQLQAKRIINRFTLGRERVFNTQPDALVVYCLDYVGVQLAYHRYQNHKILNYSVSLNMVDSAIVGKQLFVVDLYLKVLEAVDKEKVKNFNPEEEYVLNRNYDSNRATSFRFKPSATLSIEKDGKIKNYVIAVFGKEEMGTTILDEMKIYNEFLPKMKSYLPLLGEDEKDATPTLLIFVADDEKLPIAASAVLTSGQNIKVFRLSTEDRIKGSLGDNGAFVKLQDNQLSNVSLAVFKK